MHCVRQDSCHTYWPGMRLGMLRSLPSQIILVVPLDALPGTSADWCSQPLPGGCLHARVIHKVPLSKRGGAAAVHPVSRAAQPNHWHTGHRGHRLALLVLALLVAFSAL